MREGGVYLRDTTVLHIPQNHTGQAHRISVHTKEKRTQASSPLSNLSIWSLPIKAMQTIKFRAILFVISKPLEGVSQAV